MPLIHLRETGLIVDIGRWRTRALLVSKSIKETLRGGPGNLHSRVSGDEDRARQRQSKAIASKFSWNLLLSLAAQGKFDPYAYLQRHILTDEEIADIRSFPDGSRQQVDRIIEIVDKEEVCDEKMRALTYKAFGVKSTDSPHPKNGV